MRLLIIAGMPASGKSTVAKKISRHFGYPIIEKDAIKEELFDTIGFNNYSEKRRLDVAATAVLMRVSDAMLAAEKSSEVGAKLKRKGLKTAEKRVV